MRKLFNEFFCIPKQGKVCEKVMLAHMVTTIAIVLICLAAMSITAYACFSYNVTSSSNVIRSVTIKAEVQVRISDTDGKIVDTIAPVTSDQKSFKIEGLTADDIYIVSIKLINDAAAAKTGFMSVSAEGCPDTYYTQQLGKDKKAEGGETNELSFKLIVTDTTTVHLQACWGTSSYYADFQNESDELYITQDEEIKLFIGGKEGKPLSE